MEIVLFIRIVYLCLASSQYSQTCDYVCDSNGCGKSVKYQNISIKEYCKSNTSTDVSFSLIESGNETSGFPAIAGLNVKPPETDCKYEITLYANELLKEEECANYIFKRVSEIHSKFSVCFISNKTRYKEKAQVLIPYIFTACYKVQFYFDNSFKWTKGNQFLKTNYKKTELTKPGIDCVYYINGHEDNTVLRLRVNFTVPIVTDVEIRLRRKYSEDSDYESFNNYTFDILNIYLGTENRDTYNKTLITRYIKDFDFYNTSDYEKRQYNCQILLRGDIKCWNGRLWNPPDPSCIYNAVCRHKREPFTPNIDYQWNSKAYVTTIIFLVIGILYVLYITHFCIKRRKGFYRNIPATRTTTESDSLTKNVINKNIVLIYPKGSKKFMATMSDFRAMLCQTCHCTVHDWHNGAEWNHVARIGPSDWFSEMLRDKCRVVWIDVPATRLLIARNHESRNVEIGDFRDAVFPMIFNLSKWDVERSIPCEIKHFIVRFEEFDNFETGNIDPFNDLHGSARYSMPQDLELLCSNLSALASKDCGKRRCSS